MVTGKTGSVRGDLARRVEIIHDSPRPYRIALVDHRVEYEVAVHLPDDAPPELTGLALIPVNGPIRRSDVLAAANAVDRLARIAAKHARRGDTERDREATERMRAGLAAVFGDELTAHGIDVDAVTVHSFEGPGPVLVPARGRGRPAYPRGFYQRVADAAVAADDDPEAPRAVWRGVAAIAASWPECGGRSPSQTTVERWLKEARRRGIYTGPRTKTKKTKTPPDKRRQDTN